eukprot:CAMPEP_0114563708 /NCGR_PEP_ID=MMETSP0114-20121206/13276_1 /TAXON_ID=31324 /ORGANISM="Goniomonas sp, Strain m" /LENGTH=269 /DNA_ID=CAMNT_0001749617 /DNA_START=49 /DNA_END=854 /DNA_ORIENTATION=+
MSRSEVVDIVVAELDLNKDGNISREELATLSQYIGLDQSNIIAAQLNKYLNRDDSEKYRDVALADLKKFLLDKLSHLEATDFTREMRTLHSYALTKAGATVRTREELASGLAYALDRDSDGQIDSRELQALFALHCPKETAWRIDSIHDIVEPGVQRHFRHAVAISHYELIDFVLRRARPMTDNEFRKNIGHVIVHARLMQAHPDLTAPLPSEGFTPLSATPIKAEAFNGEAATPQANGQSVPNNVHQSTTPPTAVKGQQPEISEEGAG